MAPSRAKSRSRSPAGDDSLYRPGGVDEQDELGERWFPNDPEILADLDSIR